tara:strand:+ start:140 stop:559 length:420 start_codon:yes stop_codon:yes gene_type:complete
MPQESQKAPSTSPSKKPKKKSKKKSKGIGDSIEKIAKVTGVKAIVEAVAGDDCGCGKRKEWLNQRFPYAKDMTDSDKKSWVTTLAPAMTRNRLQDGELQLLIDMYHRVFGVRKKKSRCGSCMLDLMGKLEKAYEASCDE